MELRSEMFVSGIVFSNYCIFGSRGDVIDRKLRQKGPKRVFAVPMLIERWKSKVNGTLVLVIMTEELGFKFQNLWKLVTSQYTCLKVPINSYFDPFITICTWCPSLDLSWSNLGLRRHKEKVMDEEGRHQDFLMFKNWPWKWIAVHRYSMVIDFDLSINVGA